MQHTRRSRPLKLTPENPASPPPIPSDHAVAAHERTRVLDFHQFFFFRLNELIDLGYIRLSGLV